jgi:VWFA-related protein
MRSACLLLLAAIAARAQDTPATFRTDVHLVHIDVQVRERGSGRVIDVLGPQDFVILDEGEPRELKVFEIGTTPLDVVFLLYSDGYMFTRSRHDPIPPALRAAIAELHPEDRIAVLRSHLSSKVEVPLTTDHKRAEAVMLGAPSRSGPAGRGERLYDAVLAASELFPRPYAPGRRRAIVAITDDIERKSKATSDHLIEQLLETDATLNAAMVVTTRHSVSVSTRTIPIPGIPNKTSGRYGGTTPSGDSIQSAVDETGGELIPGDKFADEFPLMVRRLRGRFLLGFYAPLAKDRSFRTIEVKLSKDAQARYPDAILRARRGYYTRVASN